MSLPNFFNKKKDNQKKNFKPKNDFRQKCLNVLSEIKSFNEDRYVELSRHFHSKFNHVNVQKKKLLGFYGQLIDELKSLKQKTTPIIKKTKSNIQKVAKKAEKTLKGTKKKKVAKKATKKKVTKKKATKKKTTKKKTTKKKAAKKKVAKKKATKKKATKKKRS